MIVRIMLRKIAVFLILFTSSFSYSQCAMCKAVVENGDSDMAQGINSGIIYLMLFPYLFLALGIYFLVKRYKKNKV